MKRSSRERLASTVLWCLSNLSGHGTVPQFDPESIVVDWDRSPESGAILPWQSAPTKAKRALRGVLEKLLSDAGTTWDKRCRN